MRMHASHVIFCAKPPGGLLTEDVPGLVDHFFRREAGKMISYLTKIFGLGRLDLAEDVVQDALCRALEVWSIHGFPENPSAWLMRVARNRAIDLLRRDEQFRYFAPELVYLLRLREDLPAQTPAFEKEIQDDQLRMMFSCCHPELSIEAQVTLILKTLCGFSVSEIAHALLASEDSIEKRLGRARKLVPVFRDFPRTRRRFGYSQAPGGGLPGDLPCFQRGLPRQPVRTDGAGGPL